MSKAQLTEIVEENIEFARTDTIRQAPEIGRVPVEHYFDPQRWQRECQQIFMRAQSNGRSDGLVEVGGCDAICTGLNNDLPHGIRAPCTSWQCPLRGRRGTSLRFPRS